MSGPSTPSNSGAASSQHDTGVTEHEQQDPRNATHGADEGEWFGAFYVPRDAPATEVPDWLGGSNQGPWARPAWSGKGQMQKCICCVEETKELRQLGCGHLWDRGCLSAAIDFALQWEGNWPAKCCQKIDDIEMRTLAPFLGEDIVRRYLDKYEEMDTPRDQRIYCANVRCSAFLSQRRTEVHLDTCSQCKTSTCLACGDGGDLHDHEDCPSQKTTNPCEELIREGKLQQCPGCNEIIELREACNHITLYPGGEIETEEVEEDERLPEAEQVIAAAQAVCPHPIVNHATRRARCEYCGHRSARRMYKCARCRTAVCFDCYERLNLFAIGASALRQEAALMRANLDREDELGD